MFVVGFWWKWQLHLAYMQLVCG